MGISLLCLGFRQHQLLDVEHIGLCGGEAYPTVQQIDNFVSDFFQFRNHFWVSNPHGLPALDVLPVYVFGDRGEHILKQQHGFLIKNLHDLNGIGSLVPLFLFLDNPPVFCHLELQGTIQKSLVFSS